MPRFVWTSLHGTMTLDAKDADEAYRKVIAIRVHRCLQTLQEAVNWYAENDRIDELGPETDIEPWDGPLPDPTV